MKSKTTAILLCFFLGVLGIHRFYLGHTLIGVIQLLTFGGFGIWALIDFFRLIFGSIQVNTGDTDRTIDAMNEKNSEIAESINTLNQKTSVHQEKLEETTEEGEDIDDNLQEKRSGIDEKIVVNSGQTDKGEFENAFDVLTKFEGRRWNLLKSMKSFSFVMMILLPILVVSTSTPVDMSFIYMMLFFFLLFMIKSYKTRKPSKVNLSLDNKQKEILTIILESFKGIKSITKYEVTKTLNDGITEIDFPKFSATGIVAYFLPEGIAYESDKNFEFIDYKNLSVKKEKIEVKKDELPNDAKVVNKRETKAPVYGGWTYQNKDGSKDARRKDNPRLIDHYITTKYVTYIKTVLKIDKIEVELFGDYNFPSLKTKNELKEEKEKKLEQERIGKGKEKEERDRQQEWERGVKDKLANVSVRGKSKGNIIKELSDDNLSNEQRSYLERIVNERIEGDKKNKEQEYIQNKKDFFQGNKLTILPKGNKGDSEYPKLFIRDENYEEYELEEERVDFIVYKPEGMKGKRAYIKTDNEKNYLAWSGPIEIKDKSKFLRGDLGTVEEESQPKEEAAVQEQEVEDIEAEQEQEKELESSDASMSISERLNELTKLYDEGILTKEELQKKTAELMS